ncbi:unnamed protein product [Urochloa decumbens]|uniref:DUF4220 domain-containing protein n=1 Tax=Urochloa decumbens TaxID=240449 RepID=A0ABC9BWQ8_9POAL
MDEDTAFALIVRFWNKWGLRISVLGSLVAYVVLSVLSGARRRSASGRWPSLVQWAVPLILGVAYEGAEMAATSSIGSLSLCDASEAEQEVVAFWGPFLLLHLGRPDNMTASTLEDNAFSLRKWAEMCLQFLGVSYTIWNYSYYNRGHNSRVLFVASYIMLMVGWTRYVERAWALSQAKLAASVVPTAAVVVDSTTSSRGSGRELDDGEALLLAQDLFPTWRRALVDSSVSPESAKHTGEKIFSLGWKSMCKVVEMELSLMYEVLYTKALAAHMILPAYLVLRFVSIFGTGAATWIFWLHRNSEHGRHIINESFVAITYVLLGAAFAMDVVWLVRALGSTWTYGFLKTTKKWSWFRHKALCSGKWRQLHRAVVYLDPLWLLSLGTADPVRYRRWSGTIGRYNLLRECTTDPVRYRRCCRRLAAKIGLEETWYLTQLPKGVKKLLFERIRRILPTPDNHDGGAYTMVDITTCWGQETLRRAEKEELFAEDLPPKCAREFEEDVLMWHIATCIFLSRAMVRKLAAAGSSHAQAIEAMSEYLVFLVAQRRHMLPGLVLHSLLEETRKVLEDIWNRKDDRDAPKGKGTTASSSSHYTTSGKIKEKQLATLLRQKRINDPGWAGTDPGKGLVSDAVAIAGTLTKNSMSRKKVTQMLELIFNVWVDKLVYAGIRCARESHAKQLSLGGELTTVIWLVVHHAGPFQIGHPMPKEEKRTQEMETIEIIRKAEEKKRKKEDEEPPYFDLEGAQVPVLSIELEDEEDPEDAGDYETPVKYITLY